MSKSQQDWVREFEKRAAKDAVQKPTSALPTEPEPSDPDGTLLWLVAGLVVFAVVVGALVIMGVRLPS